MPALTLTLTLTPTLALTQALFPASKCLPPALFPVLDADGLLKPAILVLVEEALGAGLTSVVIVVAEAQHAEFESIFHRKVEIRDYNRLPPRLRQYADAIAEVGAKVTLVVQDAQLGLGHAVLSAKDAMKPEPFVLMLGDHLYRSSHPAGTSCVSQLLNAYQVVLTLTLTLTLALTLTRRHLYWRRLALALTLTLTRRHLYRRRLALALALHHPRALVRRHLVRGRVGG